MPIDISGIQKYFDEQLSRAQKETEPISRSSVLAANEQAITNTLQTDIGAQGDGLAGLTSVLYGTATSFIANATNTLMKGGLADTSKYASIAFSPLYQNLMQSPEVTIFAFAGYSCREFSAMASKAATQVDELLSMAETVTAAAARCAAGRGQWYFGSYLPSKTVATDRINTMRLRIADITLNIDNGNGINSLEIARLRDDMAYLKGILSDNAAGAADAALVKEQLRAMEVKFNDLSTNVDKMQATRQGFIDLPVAENLIPTSNTGSMFSEHSKILTGINDSLGKVSSLLEASYTPDILVENLGSIVINTEISNNFLQKSFGAVGFSVPTTSSGDATASATVTVSSSATDYFYGICPGPYFLSKQLYSEPSLSVIVDGSPAMSYSYVASSNSVFIDAVGLSANVLYAAQEPSGIGSITLLTSGENYDPAYAYVWVSDPTGIGASATAQFTTGGVASSVVVNNAGSGYSNPTVSIVKNVSTVASAYHSSATSALSGIPTLTASAASSYFTAMQQAMQQALFFGNASPLIDAASGLKEELGSLSLNISGVKTVLDGFLTQSPARSDMVNKMMDQMDQAGMGKMKDTITQGQLGSSLFVVDTNQVSYIGEAQKNLADLAAQATSQEQLNAIIDIGKDMQSEQRAQSYASITWESARDEANSNYNQQLEKANEKIGRLQQVFGEA